MIRIQFTLLLIVLSFSNRVEAQEARRRIKVDSLFQLVTKTDNDSLLIEHTFELAKAYNQINKDSTAYYIENTMVIAKKTSKKNLLGMAYYIKGFYQNHKRQYKDAILTLDTAIQYTRAVKDTFHLAESLSDYGVATWRINQYDKSLKAYNEVLSFRDTEKLKKTKLGANINSALVYEDQKRPFKAEKRYKEALLSAQELNDEYGELIIYNNLSSIYRHRKDFKPSVAYSYKSMSLAKKIDNPNEYRRAIANLGATYTQMNKNDSAIYCLQEAYKIGEDISDGVENIKTAWHLAELYNNLGKYSLARKYARISLQIAQKVEIPEDIAYGYEMLFEIEKKNKNYALANRWADSLVYWKDSLNKANNKDALANAEASYNNKLLLKDNTIQANKIESLAKDKKYLRYFLLIGLLLSGFVLFAIWNFFKKKKAQSELAMEMEHTVKLTEKVEAYRKKRATELHDDVGQDLLLAQQSIQLNNTPERTKQFIERALNKVRKISKDEYPYELNYIGLKASLEYLIDLIEQNTDLIISESLIELPAGIPESQNLNIYRVLQEMINNSIKNEDTTAVFIGMEIEENNLKITYQDNGTGFDFEKSLNEGKSIGLRSIVNRTRMLKAELILVPSLTENRYQINVPFSQ